MTAEDTASDERLVAGRYRLRERLGSGGMGTVWRADDELLQRAVAVKEVRLPPAVPAGERQTLRERSMREARAAARLDHPGAVRVFDVVEDDDAPFIVMELLKGQTLAACVRDNGPLAAQRVADIGLQLLGALAAAHRAGIVHRDVKPGNVICGPDGRVTLTDFGIASTTGDASITSTGLLLGSPAYISPERARGRRPAPPSDMWSLGATLFTAVEGRPPFDKGDPVATLTSVVVDEPAPCVFAGPLRDVLDRLLSKDPAARPDAVETRAMLLRATEQARRQPRPPAPRPVLGELGTARSTAAFAPFASSGRGATDRGATPTRGQAPEPAAVAAAPGPVAPPAPGDPAAPAPAPRRRPWGLVALALVVFVVTAAIAALVSRSGDAAPPSRARHASHGSAVASSAPGRADAAADPTGSPTPPAAAIRGRAVRPVDRRLPDGPLT